RPFNAPPHAGRHNRRAADWPVCRPFGRRYFLGYDGGRKLASNKVPASRCHCHVKSRLPSSNLSTYFFLLSASRKPQTAFFLPSSLLSRGRLGDWALQLSTPIDFSARALLS